MNWHKDHEPLPMTADYIAGFLERCNRPRAAAWVDELGTKYERARAEVVHLQAELCRVTAKLNDLLNLPISVPKSCRSKWE